MVLTLIPSAAAISLLLLPRARSRRTGRNAESRHNVSPGVGIPSMRERVKQIGGISF